MSRVQGGSKGPGLNQRTKVCTRPDSAAVPGQCQCRTIMQGSTVRTGKGERSRAEQESSSTVLEWTGVVVGRVSRVRNGRARVDQKVNLYNSPRPRSTLHGPWLHSPGSTQHPVHHSLHSLLSILTLSPIAHSI